MSYVFCTYICVISVHYTLSACHNGTHIPGTQYIVLMCFVYSCSKHIAYKIHRTYTMNSYSVWCVLLVSVWNPHWRLGGWHSKLISCYLLLHVLQCFELTLFCYCKDTCPFVMSNIHAVVFFFLSVFQIFIMHAWFI